MRDEFERPFLLETHASDPQRLANPGEEPLARPPHQEITHCTLERQTPLPLAGWTLTSADFDAVATTIPGGAGNIQDIYPLTPLQEGLLFHRRLNAHRDPYVLSVLFELDSPADVPRLQSALQTVIDRHDILRTAVLWESLAQPVQVVFRKAPLLSQPLPAQPGRDVLEHLKALMRPGAILLEVRRAPMALLRVASDAGRGYALLQIHHLICDHQSLNTVVSEALVCLQGREERLPTPMPYRQYVSDVLSDVDAQRAEAFFSRKLRDLDEPTVPFGFTEVHHDGHDIEEARGTIGAPQALALRRQARRSGVSAARLFHAAWALVVAQTSRRDDVVFGTVLLSRQHRAAHTPRALGMAVNTLPLRLKLNDLSARELLEVTHRELLELLTYQHASLTLAQRCSGLPAASPLFTALLNFRHSAPAPVPELTGSRVRVLLRGEAWSNYPVAMTVDDTGEEFVLTGQSDRRIGAPKLIAHLETAVQNLAHALEHSPNCNALALSILPDREHYDVTEGFNATTLTYPRETRICDLVEAQAVSRPAATAVECAGQRLTYGDLNRRANQVARVLRTFGVRANDRVALYVERGLDLVVGLLGIAKSGGGYVPLDTSYPSERIAYMLRDSAPVAVLTLSALRDSLPACGVPVVVLDGDHELIDRESDENLNRAELGLAAHDLAYVIYTSGSTGTPKGVMVEHRSLVNLAHWHCTTFAVNETSRCSCVAALGFDAATWEIWPSLSVGGTVVMSPPDCARDTGQLLDWWADETLDVSFLPTPLAELAFRRGTLNHGLRTLLVGGDRLRYRPESLPFSLVNNYGPTESTVVATSGVVDPKDAVLHIGRPIANTRIYILDARRQVVPVGVAGELYVGGEGVARGYLNRPDLTHERFVRDSFSHDPQARLYRTGDLARWRADGTLEFLGRADAQVKIRGFRIELGEIECALSQHALVKDVAVLAREVEGSETRLVAYVVLRESSLAPAPDELRKHLMQSLPEYMVPHAFVLLERLPLTPHGKLDRRALPEPEPQTYSTREYEAPRSEIEDLLAQLWQSLLHVKRVGRGDHFFELGGHSLLVVLMTERLKTLGLTVDARRVFSNPVLADLAKEITRDHEAPSQVPPNRIPPDAQDITPEMLPLVALEPKHIERIAQSVPGRVANIQDIYPLAPLQEGILFHHLMNAGDGDVYVVPTLLTLASRQLLDRLIAGLQACIDRHDVLRTAILHQDLPQPVQVVHRKAQLPVEELRLDPERNALEQAREWMQPQRQSMDLQRAPLIGLKVAVDPHGPQWYALLQVHHSVLDATSLGILMSEAAAHIAGNDAVLARPAPFRTHVEQTLAYAASGEAERFFREQLSDVVEPTAPFGLIDVHHNGSRIHETREVLDDELGTAVRAQARRLGVSAATLFHAAWGLVIARTSARDDIVFGSVLLGRLHSKASTDRSPGLFINTLPLRLKLAGLSASEFVTHTHRELVALLSHEKASLTTAQRCTGISGTTPLFSALLNYRHGGPYGTALSGVAGIQVVSSRGLTNFPLTLSVDDLGSRFELTAQTDARIDPNRIVGYARTALQSLLEALARTPHRAALTLNILPWRERHELLRTFNATVQSYPTEARIHELFEEQVNRTPEATAVSCGKESLTYAELNRRSNQLAHFLSRRGVGPDDFVGLCLERGIEMVIGMLGILKAGGAYVPLDPNYPGQRLRYMVEDTHPRVILTQERLVALLPSVEAVVALDVEWKDIAREPTESRCQDGPYSSANLAYIIYTSGSTGQPKGVAIEHRNAVNLIVWARSALSPTHFARTLFSTSLNFDLSIYECFVPLTTGGRLEIVANALALTSHPLEVTLINTVPSAIKGILESGTVPETTRVVNLAGEPLSEALVAKIFTESAVDLVCNLYGPSETTTYSTWIAMPRSTGFQPSIGRPIANTQIYLLDAQQQLAPLGVVGEIYIGGAGVARGYLNRPELTAERFLRDPFSPDSSARMYRTGDLGRWRADGTLEYLGRNDHQVKIRGFRIELGEIEAHLRHHARVKDAVVLAREDVPGEKRLVAYFVVAAGEETPSVEALRLYLSELVPEYMVPSAFVRLEQLPQTPNGKLDRSALPAPGSAAYAAQAFETPRGELEATLAAIWQNLLGVDKIGRHENFLALGGYSLLATRLVARIRESVGVELPIRALFEAPTVEALATYIERNRLGADTVPPLDPQPRGPRIPLSHAQERLWILDQFGLAGSAYNMALALRLNGTLDEDALKRSFAALVRRHEILRTRIGIQDSVPYQIIDPPNTFELRHAEFPGIRAPSEREKALHECMEREQAHRFDLACESPLRVMLVKLTETEHVLLLTVHHIAFDGWSIGVLVHELSTLYAAFVQGQSDPLPARTVQYADYAIWQRNWLNENILAQQLQYWKERLQGAPPQLALPTDHPRPAVESFNGAVFKFQLPIELTQALQHVARQEQATLFMVLLAAYQLLLARWSGQEDIVVGSPIAGRREKALEGLVGFFVNTLVLRSQVSPDLTFRQLLAQVRETTLGAYAHQDLPLEALVKELRPERSLARQQLFQVTLAFQNYPEAHLELPDVTWNWTGADWARTHFDLTLFVSESSEGLAAIFEYATDLFDAQTIERLAQHLRTLLEGIVARPNLPLRELPLLSDAERSQLLLEWNSPVRALPQEALIHERFEAQVRRTPNMTAVRFESEWLSYAELNARANQLAHRLAALGIARDTLVAVCVERSTEMMVAVLGTLKAGGAYLPLDPTYPAARLSYILQDAAPKIVLTQRHLAANLPATGAPVITLDDDWSTIATYPSGNLTAEPSQQGTAPLAYVIYTSGSTGQPKGVMVEHRSVLALWYGLETLYARCKPCHRVALNASLNFDASVQQIVQLLSGRTVYVLPQLVRRDPALLVGYLAKNEIEGIDCTPSQLKSWISARLLEPGSTALRMVLVGGEALDPQLWTTAAQCTDIDFFNVYGPTECTVDCTAAHLRGDASPPHIGRPMDNRRIYILDPDGRLAPVGVVGEIYVGGAGVARGYLHRPDLTAERFLPDPFSEDPQGRMYRTGDLGRWRANGTIEYLGRNDNQVKLRGFRIELGEIESVLLEHPAVRHVIVEVQKTSGGEARLVCYVVGDRQAAQAAVGSQTSDHLRGAVVGDWETVHEQTYASQSAISGPSFIGWNSSYTGQPIPEPEMQEWLISTLDRIRALRPKRVLEIGCGIGLLLEHLAPDCEMYVGTDFSASALGQLRQWSSARPELAHIELLHRAADQLTGFEPGTFDTIVLNSVVQYFPDVDYLIQVITGAARLLTPEGKIFIGDVRHLGLLTAFHSSVQLTKAAAAVNVGQLKTRIARAMTQEKELVLDPQLFHRLPGHIPGIAQAVVQLKRGVADNELTRYRYDVVLHATAPAGADAVQTIQWSETFASLSEFETFLAQERGGALRVCSIPDRRLARDLAAARLLEASEKRLEVGTVRRQLSTLQCSGVRPEHLWGLADSCGYDITMSPAEPGYVTALFVSRHGTSRVRTENDVPSSLDAVRWASYANDPLDNGFRQQLVPQLREYLKARLPEHMLPSAWMVLEQFPLSGSEKVDRAALPPIEGGARMSGHYLPPEGPIEKTLTGIWETLLQVDQVSRNDNFFELGGHSLLALKVLFKINETFGSTLNVVDLYKSSTIQELAARLSGSAEADTLIDLAREATLPSHLLIRPGRPQFPARAVLLTGSTGFVGRFLLAQLLRETSATVWCLVRAPTVSEALARIRTTLSKWHLWREEFSSRLVALPGDLGLPRLGLSDDAYAQICNRIDSIYHCGTSMNHLETYATAKAANVESARELVTLCASGRPKLLNYVSTLGVFSAESTDSPRVVEETTTIDSERHLSAHGYTASKWVAEKIILSAGERGLPCNVFRLGLIGADAEQGRYDELQREYRIFKTCLLTGYGIQHYACAMTPTPVDFVARSIVHLAHEHGYGKGRFHLSSSAPSVADVFERCNDACGTALELIPFHEWILMLKRMHEEGRVLPAAPLFEFAFAMDKDAFDAFWRSVRSPRTCFDCTRTRRELEEAGLVTPELTDGLLRRQVQYMLSTDADLRRKRLEGAASLPQEDSPSREEEDRSPPRTYRF